MKKMFYYTDALLFLADADKAIDKLERNLDIFKEAAEDIRLVWHPWSKTEHYLEINNSPVRDRYHEIVREYKEKAWGDFDDAGTMEEARRALLDCDAYYGDTSDLVYDAQNAGMPVMIQNINV